MKKIISILFILTLLTSFAQINAINFSADTIESHEYTHEETAPNEIIEKETISLIKKEEIPITNEENDFKTVIVRTPQSNSKPAIEIKPPLKYIDPNNYTEKISYNGYSEEEIRLIKDVIRIYEEHKHENTETYEEKLEYVPSAQSYYGACLFFFNYFGTVNPIIKNYIFDLRIVGGQEAFVSIYMDNMKALDDVRVKNTEKIKENIKKIPEGTEKEKALYIANQIIDNTVYIDNNYDLDNLVSNGKGVCNAYALAFNRYCQLLGITSDICIGYSNTGILHAWNKVTFSDGEVLYYDTTYYDSTKSSKYIEMKNSPFPITSLNKQLYE